MPALLLRRKRLSNKDGTLSILYAHAETMFIAGWADQPNESESRSDDRETLSLLAEGVIAPLSLDSLVPLKEQRDPKP